MFWFWPQSKDWSWVEEVKTLFSTNWTKMQARVVGKWPAQGGNHRPDGKLVPGDEVLVEHSERGTPGNLNMKRGEREKNPWVSTKSLEDQCKENAELYRMRQICLAQEWLLWTGRWADWRQVCLVCSQRGTSHALWKGSGRGRAQNTHTNTKTKSPHI